jgi:hypothetical protein
VRYRPGLVAPHDIQGGRKIHEQIDEAIRVYDKLLLILSDASMGSNWVKTEIANARAKEQQQERQTLFPITVVPFDRIKSWKLFDADTGIDSAREFREYFIPDLSKLEGSRFVYESVRAASAGSEGGAGAESKPGARHPACTVQRGYSAHRDLPKNKLGRKIASAVATLQATDQTIWVWLL